METVQELFGSVSLRIVEELFRGVLHDRVIRIGAVKKAVALHGARRGVPGGHDVRVGRYGILPLRPVPVGEISGPQLAVIAPREVAKRHVVDHKVKQEYMR